VKRTGFFLRQSLEKFGDSPRAQPVKLLDSLGETIVQSFA
jgi:hypothetical protein